MKIKNLYLSSNIHWRRVSICLFRWIMLINIINNQKKTPWILHIYHFNQWNERTIQWFLIDSFPFWSIDDGSLISLILLSFTIFVWIRSMTWQTMIFFSVSIHCFFYIQSYFLMKECIKILVKTFFPKKNINQNGSLSSLSFR